MGGCSSNQKDTSKVAAKTSPKIQKLEEVRFDLFINKSKDVRTIVVSMV
jgi:hypothetical protein